MTARFGALEAARRRQVARVPLVVDAVVAGSVAVAHLDALAAWPQWLHVTSSQVTLAAAPAVRDAALAEIHAALRAQGHIRAWRDEPFALFDPGRGAALATMERAAARFWGSLTLGAHATGYVGGADGRPTHLWIAQRSPHKATDPGLFDNLIGGGVPARQTPHEALVREGFEEAGLSPVQLAPARAVGVLQLARDIPEGWQHERLHSYDLALPAGLVPRNQDGEVAGFTLMPVAEAIELAAGSSMTVDAAVVTIDFLFRHGLVREPGLHERLSALRRL